MMPESGEFDHEITSALRQLAEEGACPSSDTLVSYQSALLAAEQRLEVERHLLVCGYCDGLLLKLKQFDSLENPTPLTGWHSTEQRVKARIFTPAQPWWRRGFSWLYQPSVAYAALGAVCLIMLLTRGHSPARPTLMPATSPAIDLNTTRSGEIRAASTQRLVVLSFWLPANTGAQYFASLDGGKPKQILADDNQGDFKIPYSQSSLPVGHHRLSVTELDANAARSQEKAAFEFDMPAMP